MIRAVEETGSTNDDVRALAAAGAAEGLWLRADRQTRGRGREGRAWDTREAGNLAASTLIRLRPTDPPAVTLALVAPVALEEALRLFAPDAPFTIKWPNDVLADGAKLSGMLLERSGDAVVLGFGVNLAWHPSGLDRPVTSVAAYAPAPDPDAFLEVLAESFARWLGIWRGQGIGPVRDRWLARAHPPGTALTARLADGSAIDGLFDGLTGDGSLILRLADGGTRVIHAGDVFLL